MNELGSLFKDMSSLVIQQGTVLDRIDYNVKEAQTNVQEGVKELQKTLDYETSWRANGCMSCLVILVRTEICAWLAVWV